MAGDVKAQLVAQFQAQGVGQALFDAHPVGLFGHPTASRQWVVAGQGGGVREVDFAVHQAFGPFTLEVRWFDLLAVDGHQAAPDHRKPVGRLHARLAQAGQKVFRLLWLHVDDKAVGGIGRGGLAPAGDQVGAQQHQQGQGQQAHRQGADLHHRKHRARGHLTRGQTQPGGRLFVGHGALQKPQGRRGQAGKNQQRHRKTAHGDQPQGEVAADHEQRQGKAQQAHDQHQPRAHLQAAQVAANHTQRRYLGQLQDWRQAKGHQQRQAHAQTHQHRLPGGGRQLPVHQAHQRQHKPHVHGVARRHAQGTGQQACPQKFQAIAQSQCALALPQHPQQGTGVQLPLGKTARGQGHRHRAQQSGQQGHQVQKLRGAVQGLAHFGPAAVQRLDLHTPHIRLVRLGFGPLHKAFGRGQIARHRHAPSDAAGRLHQAGGRQVAGVDHGARREVHEACAPVGLALDQGGDAQTALAQGQHLPGLQAQVFQQGRIDPNFAHRGNGRATGVGGQQATAQGVTGRHRFQGHQSAGAALLGQGAGHGREHHMGVGLQAHALGLR